VDINDLKEESDSRKEYNDMLKGSQELAFGKIREFKDVCNELEKIIVEEIAVKKLELITSFREYFESNDFEVSEGKRKYRASYKETKVILEDINPEAYENESVYSIRVPVRDVYSAITIKATEKDEHKLYWKNPLKHDGTHIMFDNASDVIISISDNSKLEKLVQKINENIDWYRETINNFDEIEFAYYIHETDLKFDTFKELFEAI